MSREIYRRIAPQLDRVRADGGVPTDRIADLIALQRWFEQDKDNIKLMYFPALTGNKIRTSGANKYVTKGYSFNDINREYSTELNQSPYFNNLNDWTTVNGNASNYIENIPSGKLHYVRSDATNFVVRRTLGFSYAYRVVKVTFVLESVTGTMYDPNGTGYTVPGTYTFTTLLNNEGYMQFNGSVGCQFVWDYCSVVALIQNDFTQPIAVYQPHLSGTIALNETLGIKNPNGGGAYLTHPAISFAATDKWQVTTVLNWNGNSDGLYSFIFGGSNGGYPRISVFSAGEFKFQYWNASNFYRGTFNTKALIGKNIILSFVSDGVNTIKIYVNGNIIETLSVVHSSISFTTLFNDWQTTIYKTGAICASYIIRAGAQSATDIATEASLIRAVIPEIESVKIGTQTWGSSNLEMAATPMGNYIREMQAATNVEKITNIADREFSSDTGFWSKNGALIEISGGTCNFNNATVGMSINNTLLTVGWYKITYTVSNYISGKIQCMITNQAADVDRTADGTYVFFCYCSTATGDIAFRSHDVTFPANLKIDNVSVEAVGASGSDALYTGVYNQTSGTVEQKTYAALKAAAMWCHYNNDVALGAIYGKMYNWYATSLFAMDFAYYNTANPSNPWGWDIPLQADYDTLISYLGGSSVAGGKMKMAGTEYINTPNTGATNESRFTAIAGGQRGEDGVFTGIRDECRFWAQTSISSTTAMFYYTNNTTITFLGIDRDKARMLSIRLIKR